MDSRIMTIGSSAESPSNNAEACLIIERVSRSGHVLERFALASNRVSLGRGYNQAIIIDDDYVDAAHAHLFLDPATGELTVVDRSSTNGTFIDPLIGTRRNVAGAAVIHSGDTLILGRTRLRVFRPFHAVAEARPLTLRHRFVHKLSIWPVVLLLAGLVVGLFVLTEYIQMPLEKNISRHLISSSYVLMVAIIFAGTWAAIGRTLKGDGRFMTQLMIALLAILAVMAFDLISPWLAYHLPVQSIWDVAEIGFASAALLTAVYASLRLATRLRPLWAWPMAAVLPSIILASTLLNRTDQPASVNYVPYQRALVSPALNMRSTMNSSDFVEESKQLYQPVTEDE